MLRRCGVATICIGILAGGPVLVSAGCGDDDGVDCALDSDADGLDDCQEEDRGTDPLDPDSDRDGLSDGSEVSHYGTDPTRPTLLVEVDFMAGADTRPSGEALALATSSFAHAGIEVVFEVEDQSIAELTPLVDATDMEAVLRVSRDLGRPQYMHAVFANRGEGTKHGTTHFVAPNTGTFSNLPPPENAGALLFVGAIRSDHAQNPLLGQNDITEDLLIARTLVHELGHLIGCTHESAIDGEDVTNVMAQSSLIGAVTSETIDRWIDATLGAGRVGYPTFSDASIAQMDMSFKGSVETGTSPAERSFDFGSDTSPVAQGTFRVTPSHTFVPSRGWGWDPPGPLLGLETGSSAGDDRLMDYITGDPFEEGDTTFRVAWMGNAATRVFIRLGATTDETLRVRCELSHPDRGVAFVQGTIDATTPSVQTSLTGVLAFPVLSPNRLGRGRGDLVLRCLDDDTHEDAPIEYIKVTKQDP